MPRTRPSPKPSTQPPARLLIIDDSAVARAVMTRILDDGARYAIVAAVPTAREGLAALAANTVDVIVLDLEMPGTDGFAALPDLIAAGGGARVLVVSSACADGAAATVQALTLGAADTLVKPQAGTLAGRFAELLADKVSRLAERGPIEAGGTTPISDPARAFAAIAIGGSTGGIHALGQLLRAVPAELRQPILVTQHLPASFSPYFAAQVAVLAGRPCDVARSGAKLREGRVTIAPGDAHLTLIAGRGQPSIRLTDQAMPQGCLPSVDPMFASLAAIYGPRLLAIVLSGMGRDGTEGARAVRAAGGVVVVQDRASSVVWGMPGSVAAAGCADLMLAPDAIGRYVAAHRPAA